MLFLVLSIFFASILHNSSLFLCLFCALLVVHIG